MVHRNESHPRTCTLVVEQNEDADWVRVVDGDDDPDLRFRIIAQRSLDDPDVEVRVLSADANSSVRVFIGRARRFRPVPAVCGHVVGEALDAPANSPGLYRMMAMLAAAVDERAIATALFERAERLVDDDG